MWLPDDYRVVIKPVWLGPYRNHTAENQCLTKTWTLVTGYRKYSHVGTKIKKVMLLSLNVHNKPCQMAVL